MRIVIRGGTVLSSTGAVPADVVVDGERVAALVAPDALTGDWWGAADRVIDASGKYVLPGGIDAHTHMEMPFGGTRASDTFETGTRAAAWGGTTTIIDFAVQRRGSSLLSTLDEWHARADGNCAVDYGFHMIVSDVNDATVKEMDACLAAGVNSFKMFMAYPGAFYATDGEILRVMGRAAENGAMVMMHAENGIAIDELVARALAAGRTDPVQHGLTRPPELEAEAVHRAVTLARVTGAPLYIVHLSSSHALDEVTAARDTGQNVFAETCPQYLHLSLRDLARPGFEGAKFVCSPPLRPAEHQAPAVAGPAHQRPGAGLHRPLPVLLLGAEGAGARGLHPDPQRPAGRGAPDGPDPPGRGGGGAVAGAVGGGHLHDTGQDVRPLPAQGRHRAGLRRRHRRLRPDGATDVVGEHAPHERRLLGVRGHGGHRSRGDGAVAGPRRRRPG
nr:hypothetical protein GCM10020241_46420 [Streptoalloteichus tenebrarius]